MKSSAVYSASPSSLAIDRPAGVAVLLLDLLDLDADDVPAAVFVLQQRVDLPRPPALVFELLADDQDLEPRQAVDLQLEDRVGLIGVEPKALDDLRGRVRLAVRLADDLQDLVERVEDLLEAFEDVDALLQRLELVLEPLGDDLEAEVEEVEEHLVEVQPLRTADFRVVVGGHQAREVDDEAGLQRRVLEEVRHDHLLVGVLLQLERDADVLGREVLDVHERRQLAAQRDIRDPLHERGLVDRVRHARDVDRLAAARDRTLFPGRAQADRARIRSCRSPSAPRAS